ncbi:MAG: lysophospholipase [Gemmatimonadetes bacterium]|nr:lysophospholipase [Gemmatimonadota bacterium]
MDLVRTHGYLEGVGKLRLHYRTWEVPSPRAALVVVHGHGEHSGRYRMFAEGMVPYGFSVFACTQRGHGRSDGRRGHVARFELLLEDLDRFRREVESVVPSGTPLVVVGHSFGGLVTIRYLQEHDAVFRCAVLSAPWLGTKIPIPPWQEALGRVLLRVLPALPFPKPVTPALISHDPEVVRAYEEDPLVHHVITPRMYAEVKANIAAALSAPERIRCPVLFLVPGADGVVDSDAALRFADSIPDPDVTVRVYPDQHHELFNELIREEVYAAVADWVGRVLKNASLEAGV